MHLTLQSARLYAAKKADVPLKDSSTWLLAKDSFMMYLSGAVSLGILSTWIATLTNGWLEDNPAALYSFSAYVFAPLALAVADPRWNLKLKTSAAYIGVGVLACLAFVDIIKQLIEFTETAASLCQEMRDELSSDLYNSDNDAYRRLYCSKAYMAHFGVYADITETAFYGVIVGAVAVFCFMRGVTIAKDAYYREVPKHKALDALKRAYDGHWAIQGDSMDEEGEAVEVRYPEVTSSVNLWSLLELVAGVSLLISLPVLMWHLFPKYEQDMLDAFTAQTIKNQESGINGINPKTYAETVSIIRDGQWAFVPFLYQEQAKLIPALAFLGAVLLVRKYYEVVESGNSYALHRTVSVEDIHAVELRILRGDDVGKPLYDIERKAEPKSKSCPSLSSCFMRMFGGAKAQASRTDEAVKRAAANRVNGDGGPADVDMSYDTTKTTTREGTLTV